MKEGRKEGREGVIRHRKEGRKEGRDEQKGVRIERGIDASSKVTIIVSFPSVMIQVFFLKS